MSAEMTILSTSASFNWVIERSKCLPQLAFDSLVEMIQGDVDTANTVAANGVSFVLNKLTPQKITVARLREYYIGGRGPLPEHVVTVVVEGPGISFHDAKPGESRFSVTPALDENGVLIVDGKQQGKSKTYQTCGSRRTQNRRSAIGSCGQWSESRVLRPQL